METTRELAKLDEVYRCGFITEEEHLRRRLELLKLASLADPPPRGHTASCGSPHDAHDMRQNAEESSVLQARPTSSSSSPSSSAQPSPPPQASAKEAVGPDHQSVGPLGNEVPSPSWRLLLDDQDDEDDEDDGVHDDDSDSEDTDDEVYSQRHAPYERYEIAVGVMDMSVAELRQCLADRGLPVGGIKATLVERLALYYVPGDAVFKRPAHPHSSRSSERGSCP